MEVNQKLPHGFVVLNKRGKADTRMTGMSREEYNLEVEADILLGIRCKTCRKKTALFKARLCRACWITENKHRGLCARCAAVIGNMGRRWCDDCLAKNREYKNGK
jgi:RecJ-like exonuclease